MSFNEDKVSPYHPFGKITFPARVKMLEAEVRLRQRRELFFHQHSQQKNINALEICWRTLCRLGQFPEQFAYDEAKKELDSLPGF